MALHSQSTNGRSTANSELPTFHSGDSDGDKGTNTPTSGRIRTIDPRYSIEKTAAVRFILILGRVIDTTCDPIIPHHRETRGLRRVRRASIPNSGKLMLFWWASAHLFLRNTMMDSNSAPIPSEGERPIILMLSLLRTDMPTLHRLHPAHRSSRNVQED
ncbi:hypothetical protein L218DRAFT_1079535 [Marasmius fiardii PR-910]|nr:hypothetical protein L218DRAFT_1079535 [Marasmius fiardii PR-910]